jgi:hypothetical protein
MMKRLMSMGLGLAVLGVGGAALAGSRGANPVYIDFTNRFAQASLGGAHNSPDSNSYIEVVIQGSTSETAIFFARNAAGQFAYCFATSPAILSALKSVTDDSFIYVAWDANNNCTLTEVRASSYQTPKIP